MVIGSGLHFLKTSDFLYSHFVTKKFQRPSNLFASCKTEILNHSLENRNRSKHSLVSMVPQPLYSPVAVSPFSIHCLHCLSSSPAGRNEQYFFVSIERWCNSFSELIWCGAGISTGLEFQLIVSAKVTICCKALEQLIQGYITDFWRTHYNQAIVNKKSVMFQGPLDPQNSCMDG